MIQRTLSVSGAEQPRLWSAQLPGSAAELISRSASGAPTVITSPSQSTQRLRLRLAEAKVSESESTASEPESEGRLEDPTSGPPAGCRLLNCFGPLLDCGTARD